MTDIQHTGQENNILTPEPVYYVGLGASAGGLQAIEAFFKNMPSDSGLAFVVVQHLSPDYKSLMVELLSKHTDMPIYRAEEGMKVEANSIYLIPPKKNLTIFHGKLLLSEQDSTRGVNLPIDIFFRSLAEDQGENSIGIILSGTGSDGTRGVRVIKEKGGMVMVQDEESSKFDGMPRSAAATGISDYILPPTEMPRQLMSFIRHPYAKRSDSQEEYIQGEDDLGRVFSLLREKHKIDFTFYKPSTVNRRIERRMSVNQINDLTEYVRYLESNLNELNTLFRELLIGVTSFFRDSEVFFQLTEKWLPDLLKNTTKKEVRLWVSGCSTGEEAYSLAIACRECMEKLGKVLDIKIFATDVDNEAIIKAAAGVYSESIAADLSPGLLSKYFFKQDDSNFCIARNIREMVVFAQHNVLRDPPFTNISVLSCRNLLIYLQPVLQKKVMEFFNFSLIPQGLMILGTSETIGDYSDLFETMDLKCKIYRSRGKKQPLHTDASFPSRYVGHDKRHHGFGSERRMRAYEEDKLHERILEALSSDYFSCGMIVNENMELLHILGNTAGYLQFPSGKVINDLIKIVSHDLVIPLSTGAQRVLKTGEFVTYSNIRLIRSGEQVSAQMKISLLPQKKGQEKLLLVIIEESATGTENGAAYAYDLDSEAKQRIQDLEQELQLTKENLQATIEELETSNEELQATNEELLASNEELQSTNEELQSVNEELYTVNGEYQQKIIELTELNNDLGNFFTTSKIFTLFLDENLEIRKFTQPITQIFRLIEQDVGRPLSHITHNLRNIDIEEMAKEVLESNQNIEREIQADDNEWYLLKVHPYSISPKQYSGVIITLINISGKKAAEAEIQLQGRLLEYVNEALIATQLDGTITFWNRAAEKLYQWKEGEAVGKNIVDLTVPQTTSEQATHIMNQLNKGEDWQGKFLVQKKDKTTFCARIKNSPILDDTGQLCGIIGLSEEATEQ